MGGVRIPVDSAITSHVPSTTADATNDVCCEVTLFRAVILPVTDTTAILANLVFVVTKSTVKCGQLSELITFVVVLALWSRSRL